MVYQSVKYVDDVILIVVSVSLRMKTACVTPHWISLYALRDLKRRESNPQSSAPTQPSILRGCDHDQVFEYKHKGSTSSSNLTFSAVMP